MSIAGLDYSSKAIDLALLEDDTDAATAYRFPLDNGDPRAFYAARRVRHAIPRRSWFEDHGVWLIGIEGNYRGRVNVVRALSLIQGAIVALLPPELAVVPTAEDEWKRVFAGQPPKGTKRPKPHDLARARLAAAGVDASGWSGDALDAYAVAWSVRALNAKAIGRAA